MTKRPRRAAGRAGLLALAAAGALLLVSLPAAAASAGPNYAGAAAGNWVNGANATGAADNSCASTTNQNRNLELTNFGFSIPLGATITAITVEPKYGRGSASPTGEAQLIKGGIASGDTVGFSGTTTTVCSSTSFNATVNGTTNGLWGLTFTPSEVNASDFGVRIRSGTPNDATSRITDAVRITITYTADTTPPAVTLATPANGSSTNDTTPTFSGAAGTTDGDSSTVTVKIFAGTDTSGTLVQTLTTTQISGVYSVDAAPLLPGTYTARAEQQDDSNNPGQSSANTFTVDITPPTVTIDQAGAQADPTNSGPISFTAAFSEPVSGFDASGVDTSASTAGGTLSASVSGGPTTYTVDVTGMTSSGNVVASIGASAATDAAGNASAASTSTDNSVAFDNDAPTVASSVRAGTDPTNAASVDFTVTFSESVSGIDATDFSLAPTGGVSGASVSGVAGTGATRTVSVSTGTGDGTIRLDVTDDDTIADAAGNPLGGAGSGNGDFGTGEAYTIDKTAPTVTINQAAGQSDPTNTGPISFTAVLDEPVPGFDGSDVDLSASTAGGTLVASVSGGPSTWTVDVSGMSSNGDVIASIPADSATDGAGNGNIASSSDDNSVAFDNDPPTVTIDQAGSQADPTNTGPITFTAVFSEPVSGFDGADVDLSSSTAGGLLTASVSGGPTTYTVDVSGMASSGDVVASIPGAGVTDAAGNGNVASTSTDNTVAFDAVGPTVTINQAAGQADPTNTGPITFTAVFSEPVSGFDGTDVDLSSSTAGGLLTASVSGGPTTYTVDVSGMASSGDVVASIPAAAATDGAGNPSAASTSTDNSVTFDNVAPACLVDPQLLVVADLGGSVTGSCTDTTSGVVPASISVTFTPLLGGSPVTVPAACLTGCGTAGTTTWEADTGTVGSNIYVVTAEASDGAGNAGSPSPPVTMLFVRLALDARAAPSGTPEVRPEAPRSTSTDRATDVVRRVEGVAGGPGRLSSFNTGAGEP